MAETDDWVAMASEYRAIAVLPGAETAPHLGAGAGHVLHLGAGARLMATDTATAEVVDLAATPLRDLNQRLHDLAARRQRAAQLADPQPVRRAQHRLGLDADDRGRDRGPRRATTAPA